MAYRLAAFSSVGLDEAFLRLVIDEHTSSVRPRLDRFWTYFRNPLRPVGHHAFTPRADAWSATGAWNHRSGWYTLGQEVGLPRRLTGAGPREDAIDDRARARREVVIENDIAWRIQTMIDFMFGKPVGVRSMAWDAATRRRVQAVLDAVWDASGGIGLLQDAALLGHVFGWVDFLVRRRGAAAPEGFGDDDARCAAAAADEIAIEMIDPRRGIPILDPSDYRRLTAYVVRSEHELNSVSRVGWVERTLGRTRAERTRSTLVEIISADHWQVYEDERLVRQGPVGWSGGRVPVVHVQNIAQPLAYEGIGEVEGLIPLQDELNTRLSDRACRVTMQSFKMYLAKGIEGFEKLPVGPGQVWSTDNPDASVTAFGADAESPSEDAHIAQLREAMDKASGVPPVAGGVVQGRVGNLSSANALRITLMSVLAKTARKRVTYGRGIAEVCRLVLAALDAAGVLRTEVCDRAVELDWPDPLPTDGHEQVLAAKGKLELGVPEERVLAELGYSPRGDAMGAGTRAKKGASDAG